MIPVSSPKSSYLEHKVQIDAAVMEVLQSGNYILDRTVEEFETEFAAFLELPYVAAVGNGTDAVALSLRALGIGSGQRVFTVSHTAVATVAAIEMIGAVPVLIDVDPDTFTMNPEQLERALAAHKSKGLAVAAVVLVHLYGQAGKLDQIVEICNAYRVPLIEDCAQAHGARYRGKALGSFGRLAAFSFYPTKNLGAIGDGGAVAGSDQALIEKVKALRQYGWKGDRISQIPGVNSRLDPVQAAILRVKLAQLANDNRKRRALAALYDQHLSGLVQTPKSCLEGEHVYHLYVIKTQRRDQLAQHLAERQIGSAVHYPLPVHLQPAYRGRLELHPAGLPNTEAVCQEILSLPMFPELTQDQALKVCDAIKEFGP